jgi:uncharacterized membrane protein
MLAAYVVTVVVVCWMVLGQLRLLPFSDPFPFGVLLLVNNVIQVVLCLIILVGQEELSRDADRRSVNAFKAAEATFAHVAALQAELDEQDKALGYVSLAANMPHPLIERRVAKKPPLAVDAQAGRNGQVAAWLTRQLGSMWAVYATIGFQVAWMLLWPLGLRVDRPPFAFMTLLSTVAQLLFMIIILVGQGVIGRAAGSRAEQTAADNDAALHELRLLTARLEAHRPFMVSAGDYIAGPVTDAVARALQANGSKLVWGRLSEQAKEGLRQKARQVGDRLAAAGLVMVPVTPDASPFEFSSDEIKRLGAADGPGRAISEKDARALCAALADVKFCMQRIDLKRHEGLGETDFTPGEWRIVTRAPMIAGLLVAISQGVIDPEEREALIAMLRDAEHHPRRLVREIARATDHDTLPARGTTYEQYRGEALAKLEDAAEIVASKGITEHEQFQQFLIDIGEVVALANQEGGWYKFRARRRTPNEAAAIEAIRKATGLKYPA